ncbi:unnamed protein product [Arctogadus glacialis]
MRAVDREADSDRLREEESAREQSAAADGDERRSSTPSSKRILRSVRGVQTTPERTRDLRHAKDAPAEAREPGLDKVALGEVSDQRGESADVPSREDDETGFEQRDEHGRYERTRARDERERGDGSLSDIMYND